jgi:hypothetical protein
MSHCIIISLVSFCIDLFSLFSLVSFCFGDQGTEAQESAFAAEVAKATQERASASSACELVAPQPAIHQSSTLCR